MYIEERERLEHELAIKHQQRRVALSRGFLCDGCDGLIYYDELRFVNYFG
jgi:hypothetical protein